MKQITFKLALLLSVVLFLGFICMDETMFEGKKTCNTSINIEFLFERHNINILKKYFCSDEVIKSTVITYCDKNVKEVFHGDTIINLYNDSYLEIEYQEKYADTAYFQLLSYCQNPNMENRLFDFFKPGKIICLDSFNSQLKIIIFNTCANMKKFDRIVSCIKTSKQYDKAFGVRCGVRNGLIEIK